MSQLRAELVNTKTLDDSWFVYLLRCADGSLLHRDHDERGPSLRGA